MATCLACSSECFARGVESPCQLVIRVQRFLQPAFGFACLFREVITMRAERLQFIVSGLEGCGSGVPP
jgi:hypothetical protein